MRNAVSTVQRKFTCWHVLFCFIAPSCRWGSETEIQSTCTSTTLSSSQFLSHYNRGLQNQTIIPHVGFKYLLPREVQSDCRKISLTFSTNFSVSVGDLISTQATFISSALLRTLFFVSFPCHPCPDTGTYPSPFYGTFSLTYTKAATISAPLAPGCKPKSSYPVRVTEILA